MTSLGHLFQAPARGATKEILVRACQNTIAFYKHEVAKILSTSIIFVSAFKRLEKASRNLCRPRIHVHMNLLVDTMYAAFLGWGVNEL